MLRRLSNLITGTGRDPARSQWQDALDTARPVDLEAARALRIAACAERTRADHDVRQADARLRQAHQPPPTLPRGAVWAQRPAAWTKAAEIANRIAPVSGTHIAPDLTLFHDCPLAEMVVRQTPAEGGAPAPFVLTLDSLRFRGSFLSLVIPLPEAEATALTSRDVLQLDLTASMTAQTKLYGRLNLGQGPNDAQMLAEFPSSHDEGGMTVAFDLAYANLRDSPVERAWIDLIVERPAMLRLTFHDLVLSRRPRAEL